MGKLTQPPNSCLISGHTLPVPPSLNTGSKAWRFSTALRSAEPPSDPYNIKGNPAPLPTNPDTPTSRQHPQHNTLNTTPPNQPSSPYYNKPPGAKEEGNQAVKRKKNKNKAKVIIKTENNRPGKTASRASRAAACLFGRGRRGREIPARRRPGSLAAAPRPLPPGCGDTRTPTPPLPQAAVHKGLRF